jgi:hypothetical protein
MNRRSFMGYVMGFLGLSLVPAAVLAEDGTVSIPEGECEIECFDENMNPVPCLDPCPVEEPEPEPELPPVCYHIGPEEVCCRRQDESVFCYDPGYEDWEDDEDDYSPHVVQDQPVILTLPRTGTGG